MEKTEATNKKKQGRTGVATANTNSCSSPFSPSAAPLTVQAFPHNSLDIRLTPEFRCQSLLKDAWSISPYNKKKNRKKESSSQESDDDVRAEIIDQAMCFQPKEGYCGIATVNTVTRSLDPPYYVPYGNGTYRAFSICNLTKTLEHINYHQRNMFTKIEPIILTEKTTLDEFRCYLKEANTASCRILANFHRKPLFGIGYGHWSPIGAVVVTNKSTVAEEEEYVMVLDTNDKYGPFMVSLQRFFLAVKTPTSYGTFRGLIKVHLPQ